MPFDGWLGESKGGTAPFRHTTLLARSSVLCLFTNWREKECHRSSGDTLLSDRKTGRNFVATADKISGRFQCSGQAYNPRVSFHFRAAETFLSSKVHAPKKHQALL